MGKMKELWAEEEEINKKRAAVRCEISELIMDIRQVADPDNMVLNEMLKFLEENRHELAETILAKYAHYMR